MIKTNYSQFYNQIDVLIVFMKKKFWKKGFGWKYKK